MIIIYYIILAGQSYGNEGTEYVIQWLKGHPKLQTLGLSAIHDDKALKAICAHMEKKTTLMTELSVIYYIRLFIRYGAGVDM